MLPSPAVLALRSALPPEVSATLTSGTEISRLRGGREREARGELLSTALPAVDGRLGGGLPRGALVELDGGLSSGRFSVVLATLAAATGAGESAALVDLGDHLDPQAAHATGVDLSRLLWVRPRTTRQALAAAEILLAAGFPLVILDLGLALRGKRPNDAAWIRLARAAATHHAAFLVSSPYRVTGIAASDVLRVKRGRPLGLPVAPYGCLLLGLELDLDPGEGRVRPLLARSPHDAGSRAGTAEARARLHALEVPRGMPGRWPSAPRPVVAPAPARLPGPPRPAAGEPFRRLPAAPAWRSWGEWRLSAPLPASRHHQGLQDPGSLQSFGAM